MSRPIKLTDQVKADLVTEFAKYLEKVKMSDGKLSYTTAFKYPDKDSNVAVVTFSAAAFAKMMMLVMSFDSEVAWHGTVKRDGLDFYIEDILIYPQEVSGATVTTDQDEYTTWLYDQEDEVFNAIRFQGHSHVNMTPTPSATDLTHQESILEQLGDDDFYIFAIWNKKMQFTLKIYDIASNTLYENDDIIVGIGERTLDLASFMEDATEKVKKATYGNKSKKSKKETYDAYDAYDGYYGGYGYLDKDGNYRTF